MFNFLTGNTPEKWEEIRTSPYYADARAELLAYGKEILDTPMPELRFTSLCRFLKDGDRKEFEIPYKERRRRVSALALLSRLYGEEYVPALSNAIWAICEEHTWALPAHIKEGIYDKKTRREFLELCSTETGALLSEIMLIVGDMLPEVIVSMMRTEVRERVIDSYFKNLYWWFDGANNWGAVCGNNVAECIMVFGTDEEFYRAEPTLHRTMELFIASYGTDGCCLEGVSYWNYGFGFFLRYADAVRNYTRARPSVHVAHVDISVKDRPVDCVDGGESFVREGVVDYFLRSDVKQASLYPLRMHLAGDRSVSFSDGPSDYTYSRTYFTLLCREYPDDFFYPNEALSHHSFCDFRYYLWSDPTAKTRDTSRKEGTVYYPEAQWYVYNGARYSLAAKAGCNNESHNHNDVGSFLLTLPDGGMPLCDLGSGLYTKQYFEPETRYSHLVTSSRGHSVPVIDGAYQVCGKEKATVLEQAENTFAFAYGTAYALEGLKETTRRFVCDGDGVTVTDTFSLSTAPASLVERFVSRDEPVLLDGEVKLGSVRLVYDKEMLCASVWHEDYLTPDAQPCRAYFLDLTAREPKREMTFTFRILVP